jgi:MFS family permease
MKRFSYRTKKICALVGSAAIQLCVGIKYIWSNFRVPVMEYLGWDSAKASLTFSIMFPLNMAGVIAGGLLLRPDRPSPGDRRWRGAGCSRIAAGFAGYEEQRRAALLFYSGMCGIGGGLCYAAAIVNANRWWPERKGLATGITVGAYGCSTVLFGARVDFILSTRLGVSGTFRLLAFVFSSYLPLPPFQCAFSPRRNAQQRQRKRRYGVLCAASIRLAKCSLPRVLFAARVHDLCDGALSDAERVDQVLWNSAGAER